jgi:GNAT superfamily N-acetyltransferase
MTPTLSPTTDMIQNGHVITKHGEYELTDDPDRVDFDAAWAFLSEHAYWGRWRTRDDFAQQVRGSWRVVGAYRDGEMVGFARALSDGLALAYLADVYVHPDHRGHGLGVEIVRMMVDEGPGAEFRWLLHTADAHDLYARFGFAEPPATVMERPAGSSRPATK